VHVALRCRCQKFNCYVRNDMIGSAPLARGYEGIIPKAAFKLLVLAVESYIQIKQLNCEVIVWQQLLVVVNKMCGIASIDRIKENMLDRVMRSTPVSFDAIVAPPVEERRLLWTTYDNLHTWFMSFKEFCFKFEFAMPNCNGEAVFSPEMLRRIGNVDETELSLDGSETQAGGRPAMSYRDPHLPMIMIILLKVDSGPGRNCMSLLVSCRFRGLYLFPGLPNATSVQQETDRNYGLFKKVVRRNLAALATSCYAQKSRYLYRYRPLGSSSTAEYVRRQVSCVRMPSPKHFPWIGTWSVGLRSELSHSR
jgi:hypothetical protein